VLLIVNSISYIVNRTCYSFWDYGLKPIVIFRKISKDITASLTSSSSLMVADYAYRQDFVTKCEQWGVHIQLSRSAHT